MVLADYSPPELQRLKGIGPETSRQKGADMAKRLRDFVPAACRIGVPFLSGLALMCLGTPARAQIEFERPPINYHETKATDPIAGLQAKLDRGEATLGFDKSHGYLPAVLKALDIPQSSQMLVFSKTSFQLRRIDPSQPRAVYFNDDTYIGCVQNGDVVEVSTVDPKLGGVFYTLSQKETDKPVFLRDKGQCLVCHASSRTQGVPGHVVRSVFTDEEGQPRLGTSTFTTEDRSPFSQRWGGWYVSGTHGAMRHMGNVLSKNSEKPEVIDREVGANAADLSRFVAVSPYLRPTSDIVALMVLEHQTQMHNAITLASYETQSAIHYDGIMNDALSRDPNYRSDSTQRRIAAVGDKLLKYLLFSEEFTLTSPIAGVSSFREDFSSRGPKDSRGRSLRDFDLQTRLFKYPCSYLIYSPAFDALPAPVREHVARRLRDILAGSDKSPEFLHLSAADRQNILEILRETKPGLMVDPADKRVTVDDRR